MTTDETSIDTDAPEDASPEPEAEQPTETDELAKWKAMSRKNEKAAKDALARLEELERQNETEQQRAVREAADMARAEVLADVGADRVADAIRVAAAGRDVDVDELIDALDLSKFLGDDGNPDRDRITQVVTRITPDARQETPFPDVGQGHRTTSPPADPFLADLKRVVGGY